MKSPPRDILVEDLNGALWIAAVEKGQIEAIDLDPQVEDVRWGSIYWAQVMRIDTRLNAAFLNLDGETTGIIQAQDVWITDDNGAWVRNTSKTIGQVLKTGQMIVAQVKDARLVTDPLSEDDTPLEQKASRLSMDIALQGRFLIYTPLSAGHKISARITDAKTRAQLATMLEGLDMLSGCILRASAAYTQTDMLMREGHILKDLWAQLENFERDDEPGLIWAGPDAVHRVLADQAAQYVRAIEVSTPENFAKVEEWALEYAPDLVTKITQAQPPDNVAKMRRKQQHYEDLGLFEWHDLVDQINSLLLDYVLLPSGASLIIQETAVATTIDINSAGAKSVVQANQEAMRSAARHMRLRNLGGVILIDPAGNVKPAARKELEAAFRMEMAKDPHTIDVYGFTRTGLFECTRARRTPTLMDRIKALD